MARKIIMNLTSAEINGLVADAEQTLSTLETIQARIRDYAASSFPLSRRHLLLEGACEILNDTKKVFDDLGVYQPLPAVEVLEKHAGWISEDSLNWCCSTFSKRTVKRPSGSNVLFNNGRYHQYN